MGDVRYVHIPLSRDQHNLAIDVKNGETWEDFFMRLIKEEKQRKDNY